VGSYDDHISDYPDPTCNVSAWRAWMRARHAEGAVP
jgi:hypothetical protein